MKKLVRTFASAALFVFLLALPAGADDFKLGIGGGATFPVGDFADSYNTGWNATVRALWLPSSSVFGIRGAGYYGQNTAKYAELFGTSIDNASLYGVDANAAFRLTGKGAEGLYGFAGVGFRSLRQGVKTSGYSYSQTDTNVSGNAGLGYSAGPFFVEANAVYFQVNGTSVWSIPVTVGFQF